MHQMTTLPQTPDDFIWWAFQLAFLALVWFMKRDLGEIKADTKANRQLSEATASKLEKHRGICEERHKRLDYELVDMKEKLK